MKNNKLLLIITSIVILLPIVFGLIVWDKLPEQIATHWGADGNPDGYSSRELAVFGLPAVLFVVQWFAAFITSKDPKNKGNNKKPKELVFFLIPILSLVVSAMMYATALGSEVRVEMIMPLFLGLMLVVLGNYMPKCRQNYTIGIKVSWTLNSEENWNATHRFAGKLWMIGGVLVMLCALLPGIYTFVGFMTVSLIMVIVPIVYSYQFYKKESK